MGTGKHNFPNSILRAAKAVGLQSDDFCMVSPARWRALLTRIMRKFTGSADTKRLWIWNDLTGDVETLQATDGPNNILSMMGAKSDVWFIAEDWSGKKEEGCFWVFSGKLSSVVAVLGDLHAFEYAIVDKKLEWIICENHHNILVASGEPAVSKLRELRVPSHPGANETLA